MKSTTFTILDLIPKFSLLVIHVWKASSYVRFNFYSSTCNSIIPPLYQTFFCEMSNSIIEDIIPCMVNLEEKDTEVNKRV